MFSLKLHKTISYILASALVLGTICPVYAEESTEEHAATVSANAETASTNDGEETQFGTGYIAPDTSIYDFGHGKLLRSGNSSSDSSYISTANGNYDDGTPKIALSPDNQGNLGICWVYAVNKAIEHNIYLKSQKKADLSEKNTAYYYWHQAGEGSEGDALLDSYSYLTAYAMINNRIGEPTVYEDHACYDTGGNAELLDNYLADWKGITADKGIDMFESGHGVPNNYILDSETYPKPDISNVYSSNIAHVKNIYKTPITDTDNVKKLIKQYGAATVAVSSTGYNSNNNYPAWYNATNDSNHQVIIIGWDDSYPKERFAAQWGTETPGSDGAWYCMNSWGENARKGALDRNGCFWLSYCDRNLHQNSKLATAYDVSLPGSDDWYSHNYIGGRTTYIDDANAGTHLVEASSYGIKYTAQGNNNTTGFEKLKAVGFTTFETNSRWTIEVYKGDSNTAVSSTTVYLPDVGFHTIGLNKYVDLAEGDEFRIEVKPKSGGRIEYSVPNESAECRGYASIYYNNKTNILTNHFQTGSAFGTSYINGNTVDNMQLMIHAYTVDSYNSARPSTLSANDIEVTYGDSDMDADDYFTFVPGTDDEGKNPASVEAVSNNPNIVSIGENNTLKFVNAGETTVTLTTSDNVTKSIKVTVNQDTIQEDNFWVTNSIKNGYKGTNGNKPVVLKNYDEYMIWTEELSGNWNILVEDQDYKITYKDNDKTGTATITATGINNYKGTISKTFEVVFLNESDPNESGNNDPTINVTGVSLNTPKVTIEKSKTYVLTAIITPSDASNKNVEWTSTDKNVATINTEGVITAVGTGKTEVKVTTKDGNKTAVCEVTVINKNEEPDSNNGEGNNNPENNNGEGGNNSGNNNEEINNDSNNQNNEGNNDSGNNGEVNNDPENNNKEGNNSSETITEGENNDPESNNEEGNNSSGTISEGENNNPDDKKEEKDDGSGNNSEEGNNNTDNKTKEENNTPDKPDNSNIPENPNTSDSPNAHDDPGTPDNPVNPEKPDTSDISDKPVLIPENPADDKGSSEKTLGSEEKIDENINTITTSSLGYTATVSMNKSIPNTKSKSGVINALNYKFVFLGIDGKPCGISVKKVKSTKPKHGSAKVTFKLKGSTKEEKKAVKALNKSFKKILITIENIENGTSGKDVKS